jgi:biopolymer transport protein ExbB
MDAVVGYVNSGGPVIMVLLALSALSITLIFIKAFDLWHCTAGQELRDQIFEQLSGANDKSIDGDLLKGRSPADRILAYAVSTNGDPLKTSQLAFELERRGNREVSRMNRFLRVLELIAMIAPLLGLLGTVLGMIQSFQQLEMAGGAANAAVLAGGIWQALLTTAAGLIVAIPAAIGASLFGARVEIATHHMEDTIGRFLSITGQTSDVK